MIEADALRELARGRWPAILGRLAPELEQALARIGKHGPCPVHGGKDGFRLFPDGSGGGICATCGAFPDGFALLRWLRGWSFPEVLQNVAEALGVSEGDLPLAIPKAQLWQPRPPTPEQAAAIRHRLRQTWRASAPLHHPKAEPVRRYLAGRGLNPEIALTFRDLRGHPGLAYFEDGRRMKIKTFVFAPGLPIPQGQNSLDWLDVLNQNGALAFPVWKAGAAEPKAA